MKTNDELKSDFDFIAGEFIRFARMSWDELRPHLEEDSLYQIKDAKGHNRIIGHSAAQRLATRVTHQEE